MHAESNKLNGLGQSTIDIEARRFYYLPLFAFVKLANGTDSIKKRNETDIAIPIILQTKTTKSIFVNYLKKHNLINESTSVGQVQMVDLNYLNIKTVEKYLPITEFKYNKGITPNNNFLELTCSFNSAEDAQKFIKDFKNNDVNFEINLGYQGYNNRMNNVVIDYSDIRSTKNFNDINGPGGQGFVSRKKIGELIKEASLSRNVTFFSEFEDKDFATVVNEFLQFTESKQNEIQNGWVGLEREFQNLGIDPEILRSDLITSSKNIKNGESRTYLEKLVSSSNSIGGGFSIAGFGASADVKNTEVKKTIEDVFNKYGVNYEESGEKIIPKSITIYKLDTSKLINKGQFTLGNIKRYIGEQNLPTIPISLNTHSLALEIISKGNSENCLMTIGTIISSYLNWEEFQQSNKNNEYDPSGNDGWNAKYSKWSPADGRNVSNSSFQFITKEDKVPDYRGIFLRGLNTFDMNEAIKVNDLQKDPNVDIRNRNTPVQLDSLAKHTHFIRLIAGCIPSTVPGPNGNVAQFPPPNLGFNQVTNNPDFQLFNSNVIDSTGGTETRPKNKAVYFYIRIN